MNRIYVAIVCTLVIVFSAVTGVLSHRISDIEDNISSKEDVRDAESWVCIQYTCIQFVDPEIWIKDHCTEKNSSTTCQLSVNREIVEVDLLAINQTYLAQQCVVRQCIEEVPVRAANYTVAYNESSFILS